MAIAHSCSAIDERLKVQNESRKYFSRNNHVENPNVC